MALFHLLLMLLSSGGTAMAVEDDCEPMFPAYRLNGSYDAKNLGCYYSDDTIPIFPESGLVNLWSAVDVNAWAQHGHARDIIRKCGRRAVELGVAYFGIRSFGECFLGDQPDLKYGDLVMPGESCTRFCSFDVGGHGAMVVYQVLHVPGKECRPENLGYTINYDHWAQNRGCYHNREDKRRVLQTSDMLRVADLGGGGMDANGLVRRCGVIAVEKGVAYFGIGNINECYFGDGPNFSQGHVKDRCDAYCSGDVGLVDAVVLYQVNYRSGMDG